MKLHEQVKQLDKALEVAVNGIEEIRSLLNQEVRAGNDTVSTEKVLGFINDLDNELFVETIKLNG